MLLDKLMGMGEMLLDPTYRKRWLEDRDSDMDRERWRFFFSTRLQAASYFETADHMVQRAIRLERSPWAEAGPAIEALDQETGKEDAAANRSRASELCAGQPPHSHPTAHDRDRGTLPGRPARCDPPTASTGERFEPVLLKTRF